MANAPRERPVVLITGAAGAIGSAMTGALGDDYHVVGLDLHCDGAENECYECDLSDETAVAEALGKIRDKHGSRLAAVIHLAAYFDFTGEDNPLYEKVNIEGTRTLLRALQDFEVERFFYSGTMLVHEPAKPGERIDESAPIAPKWVYPQSKARAEEVIREERGDIPVTLFHLAGLYDDRHAVPTLAHQIARIYERDMKSHLYAGDLKAGQSMIHIDDMLDLFARGLERRKELPECDVILAGEPEGVAYQALQEEIGCLVHGEDEWRTLTLPKPAAKAGAWVEEKSEPVVPDDFDHGEKPFIRPFMIDMASDHYALDISRATEQLGWRPEHDIRDELPSLVEALKDDPLGWYQANGITPPDWLEAAAEKTDNPETIRKRHREHLDTALAENRWAHLVNAALGTWLIASPGAFVYDSVPLIWSDVATGLIILVFSLASASARIERARWIVGAAGIWLLAAPLVFWAPTAAVYLNQTLVGTLVIGFAICTRPAPGVSPAAAMTGPDTPPGWDFSPSGWMQRLPIIILAVVGFLIARHLTAYQLGHIEGIWEPFFEGGPDPKNGSEEITTSPVSEAWPVPDAGLGAMTYMLEILTGILGTRARWRTMPWLVMLFGFMIVPLGVVSITFIIIQPIMLGTYCTLCLIGAAAMLLQIPYSLDELVATSDFLVRRAKKGRPVLRIFFVGDTDEGDDKLGPEMNQPFGTLVKEMLVNGVGVPWNIVLCAGLGIWLMLTPLTLGAEDLLADANHLIGALVLTASVICFAETARPLRFINMVFGLALIIVAFTAGGGGVLMANGAIVGLALIALSLRRGAIVSRYGAITRYLV